MTREPRAWQLLLPMPARCVRVTAVPPAEIERRLAALLPCVERTTRALAARNRACARRCDLRSLVLDLAWRVAATWRADGGARPDTLLIGIARREVRLLRRVSSAPSGFARGGDGRGRLREDDRSEAFVARGGDIDEAATEADLRGAILRRLPDRLRQIAELLIEADGNMRAVGKRFGVSHQRIDQLRRRIAEHCVGLLTQGDTSEREAWRRRLGLAGKGSSRK